MRTLALGLVALLLAAPAAARARPTSDERHWIARIDRFVDDLHANVVLASSGGADLASARRALRSTSHLYATLVAYTYFGGCRTTLRNVGEPPSSLGPAARSLVAACRGFEHAAGLFTRAIRRSDARDLLAATRESLAAFATVAATRQQLDSLLR